MNITLKNNISYKLTNFLIIFDFIKPTENITERFNKLTLI